MSLKDIPTAFVFEDERDLPKTTPEEYAALPQKHRDEYELSLREQYHQMAEIWD